MTQLVAGDLAIVGYDSNDPDDFTFVLLRDIDAGTVISFTDNGWLASGGFRSGEGTVTYTAATAVAAGTAITLTGLDLDSAGDQIIAYQGSPAAPTLLYAIDFADGDNAFAGDATSANTSALPSGLILGSTAVAIAFDNAAYTGPIPPTQAALLAAISDPANWSGSDILRGLPGSIFGAGRPEIDLDDNNSTHGGRDYETNYAVGGTPARIGDVDIRISDSDGSPIESATIRVNGADPGDLLAVNGSLPVGITASTYDPGTGILTLSGTASFADYQTAIGQVRFSTTDGRIGNAKRVQVTVSDGTQSSPEGNAFIQIVAATAPPVLDLDANNSNTGGADYTATFQEGGPAIRIADVDVTITDPDSTAIASATVTIGINRQADDLLSINGALPAGIVASAYNSSTGVLTLTGSASLAAYQTALHQVVYSNSSSTPFTGDRVIEVTVNDGTVDSNIAHTFMQVVAAVNSPPLLNLDADSSTTGGVDYLTMFTDGGAPVAIVDTDVLILDSDSTTLASATITLTNPHTGDILVFNGTPPAGITASSYDPVTGVLTLTGIASLASYQGALRQITFDGGLNPDTDSRIIEIVVNDGIAASNTANAIVNVLEVNNSAPDLSLDPDDSTAPGSSYRNTFTENGAPVPIADVDTTITDPDSTTMASARITLTDPQTGDLLTVSGTLPAGIVASIYDPVAGILTLTGTASLIDYQTALKQVGFSTAGDDPVAGQRILEVVVNDGVNDSNAATALITVVAVNDAPVITIDTSATYVENTAGIVLSPLATLFDVDNSAFIFAAVEIADGSFAGAGDVLTVNGATSGTLGGVNFLWDPALATLVFNGAAPVATYQALFQQVEFASSGDNPTDFNASPSRTLLWTVTGGDTSATVTSTVDILALNDAPVLTVAATADYTENAPPVTISPSATVTDADNLQLTGGQIAIISGGQPGDLLTVNGTQSGVFAGIEYFYDDQTGRLVFQFAAPVADYQGFVQAVQFQSTSDDPTNHGAAPTRTLAWALSDGLTFSTVETTTLNINAVDDAPVNTVPGAQSVNEDTALAISGVTVADVDSSALTTTLTVANGTLNVTPGAGVSGNGTGTVIIAGTAAEINAALVGLTYQGNLNFNGPDTLTVVTSDTALADTDTVAITVTAVNDAPALDLDANNSSGATGANYTATFTEGGPPVAIADTDALVTDVDSTFLLSATIRLLNHQTDDLLSITGTLPAGIAASAYDPATGVITLTSVPGTSLADFQAALHAIAFSSSSTNPDPTDRIVNVVVSDGLVNSNPADAFIHVVPLNNSPTLDLDANGSSGALTATGYTATFTQGGAAVAIADVDTVISDADNTTLKSATITLTNAEATDVLSVNGTLPVGLTASIYDPATGILTITGAASLTDYQTALHQIEYSSSSASPDTATRIIEVVVNDGANDSAAAFSFMHVIDNPPTLDLDANNSTAIGTDFVGTFTEGGAPAPIADTDVAIAGSANIVSATITLTNRFADDILSASGTPPGGITASGYDPVTGMLTLTGTASLADYQTALRQIGFSNSSDDPATDDRIIEVVVNDGIGDSNAATAIIHVNAVNDPPTLAVAGAASYVENTPPVTLSPAVAVGDPDNTILTAAAVAITAGALAGDVLTLGGSLTGRSGAIQFDWLPDVQHLILFGPGSPAEYEALLQSVQFHSTSDDPTGLGSDPTRTISWTVFDGAIPVTETTTLNVTAANDAPILGNVAASATFAAHASPVTLSPGIDVADIDSPNLIGAVVKITDGSFAGDGDLLTANTAGTAISGVYDAVTETLTLSGADTLAHYQQALATVTFQSTSANPTNSELNPTRTISWQLDDGGGVNNLSAIAVTNLDIITSNGTIDLNGDGKGDILWQHEDSTPGAWLVDALTVLSTPILGLPEVGAADWLEIGSGDFNGDGKSDVLWQHSPISTATGPASAPGIWLMDGTTVQAHDWVGTPDLWSTDWTVIGSGDFNGDGKSDILWQHSPVSTATGPASAPGIWLMDGTAVQAHDLVGTPDLWSVDWTVIGSGDFNGDGKADILWQNSNGEAGIWLMDGLTVVAHDVVGANPGPSAHAIGTGDFNGDGKADILWQNDNGQASIWLMDGLSVLSARDVGDNPGTSWKVIGANDLNADGKADILWQHDDGTAGGWLMDGTTVLSTGVIGENPGPQWDMIPRHDLAI